MKKYFLSLLLLLSALSIMAQEDPFAALDAGTKTEKEYVSATFKGDRLVNFHTVETPGKRTLQFRISHRFGDLNGGYDNFYGMDGGATIWMGLDYSYDGRLVASIGRESVDKEVTSSLKYKLLRQTLRDNSMPVTVTLLAGANINTSPEPSVDYYKYTSSRMNYVYQLMIARKFTERISLQVSPTLIHYNLVQNITDKNDIMAVCGLARYKFSRSCAITGEYGFRANKYTANMNAYQNVFGIGLDVETGGHVFQLFFTNTFGIMENQSIPYTTGLNAKNQQIIRLGFNISRAFAL